MKINTFTTVLAFVFLMVSTFSTAQEVTLSPDFLKLETEGKDMKIEPSLANVSGEEILIYWIYEKGENYPDEWEVQICDSKTCYPYNTLSINPTNPNDMLPDATFKFEIKVRTNDVAGDSYGILRLYTDPLFENEIYVSSISTSTKQEELKAISVYPNPTSDFIVIKDDQNVASVQILSISGNVLGNAKHVEGNRYSISEYTTGYYLIRSVDKEGKISLTEKVFKL